MSGRYNDLAVGARTCSPIVLAAIGEIRQRKDKEKNCLICVSVVNIFPVLPWFDQPP